MSTLHLEPLVVGSSLALRSAAGEGLVPACRPGGSAAAAGVVGAAPPGV
jgi:hypothetical protein